MPQCHAASGSTGKCYIRCKHRNKLYNIAYTHESYNIATTHEFYNTACTHGSGVTYHYVIQLLEADAVWGGYDY